MLKNQEQAQQIVELFYTFIDAAMCLYDYAVSKNYTMFDKMANELLQGLKSVQELVPQLKNDEPNLNIDLACDSVIYSLERIIIYSGTRSKRILSKIEFELIPLIQDMLLKFYFWGCVYPDRAKMDYYYENEMVPMTANQYIDEAEKRGEYKYDLSIIVTGYNKVEYTKLCVNSILAHVPKDINYELILLNHGSTDSTMQYFESLAPTKQIDILKNGGGFAASARVVEGKYTLGVSNDVVVTENAIQNMLRCIESDEMIAYVVPSTPNVSNLQTIPSNYNTMEGMHEFAKKNNVYDEYRHEQRVRLCDPISMSRSKYIYSSEGLCQSSYFFTPNILSFPDDLLSLLMRRRGYKLVLAKDAYCYHFGSITIREDIAKTKQNEKADFYSEGRMAFCGVLGIDPWGIGCCFSPELFTLLSCDNTEHTNVLGINCGLGSNPLKVRETIKENAHNLDVCIYNITDNTNVLSDLKGVSDSIMYANNPNVLKNAFPDVLFDYIIIESGLESIENPIEVISHFKNRITTKGKVAICCNDAMLQEQLKNKFENIQQAGNWFVF